MNPIKYRQNGMTLISFLVFFVVVGFFILLTLKTVPVYLEHFKIESSLEGLKKEAGLAEKSQKEIRGMLQKRWDMNTISGISTDEDVTIEKSDGVMTIQVAYEKIVPFIANMSLLIKFDDSITVGSAN